jgi:O-antigen/teichoic acid export membrane protein
MISLKYKEVIKSFGAYGLSNVSSQFLLLIYGFLLANHLGPALFGVYSGHIAFVLLLSFVINWGLDTYLLFESGTYHQTKSINELTGKIIFVKLYLGVLWISALLLISKIINPDFFEPDLIFLASIDVLADSLFFTQLAALNVNNATKKLSALLVSSRVARLLTGIFVIMLGITSIQLILLLRLAATSVFAVFSILITKTKIIRMPFKDIKALWYAARHYGFSETLAIIYAQLDLSLLAIILGDVATGLYTTSSRLIIALYSIPNAAYLLFIPRLRKVFLTNRRKFIRNFFIVQAGFFLLGLVLFLSVYFSGKWIISLLLPDTFAPSGELLQLMSIVALIKSINYGFGAFLVAVEWQKNRLIPQFIASVLALILNLIILPKFGLPGAAYIFIINEVVLLLGYAGFVLKWLTINRASF